MKKINLICALLICTVHLSGQDIIPRPVSVILKEGAFHFTPDVRILFLTNDEEPLASYLSEYLPGCRVFQGIPSIPSSHDCIRLSIDPGLDLPQEGYRIDVSIRQITITGKDYGGLFNGIQTFLQLLPPEVYTLSSVGLDAWIGSVSIEDHPRFGYRGMMLDVARTFIPKDDVLRHIDLLAYHKINRLHWHLVDDEGWRIEIQSYPELAATGGFRGGDSPIRPIYGAWDRKYGGYYTREKVRQIVQYASLRNIEIIPEIDLPEHSRTAAIVYPEILCDYTPDLTATAGYDRRNVWCCSKESNYEMLDRIIGELSELFPSEYIHLGGDEVEPGQWSRCPHCQALLAERGISQAAGLEDVFMDRVVAIAARHGKKAAAWVEATYRGNLDRSVLVSGWKNEVKTTRKAAADGHPTIMMAGKYFYFDMRQSQNEVGHIWAGIVSPETVYSCDFGKEGFTDAEMRNIKGIEATFFSELLLSNGMDFLDYQLYPRVCALSEVAWTPQQYRSWGHFQQRLAGTHYARMDAMGIKYRTGEAKPAAKAARLTPTVTFSSSLKQADRYPYSNLTAYKGMARSTVTCSEGDWFLFQFRDPVDCTTVKIATGYEHLPRAGIPRGRVEISYDGTSFEKVADLHDFGAVITPARSLKAVRIVSETKGNGEPFVILQPLEIR